MWQSPNVADHVDEYSEYRIRSILDFQDFDSKEEDVGDYKYIYTGKYKKLTSPDIAADKLMKNIEQLNYLSEEYTFPSLGDFKSSVVSYNKYGNVFLYPILLAINKTFTNAHFNNKKLKKMLVLHESQMFNFIAKNSKNFARTVEKLETSDDYTELYKTMAEDYLDNSTAVDDWLNLKIPNTDFEDIQYTPEYEKLVNELGEDKVQDVISLLDKYQRIKVKEDNYV